jgi:arsenate reductase
MAEAYLNHLGGESFEAESAGLKPGTLNPVVVKAMKLEGIDISAKTTHSVFDFYKEGRRYHYVITVCDESQAEQCPIFPGITKRFHWSFSDPASFSGKDEEVLEKTIEIRDRIKEQIRDFIETVS